MEKKEKEIIVVDSLESDEVPRNFMQHYFTHILCHKGSGQFSIDDKKWTIEKNDIAILLPNTEIQDLKFSPGFKATFLLLSYDLLSKNNPDIGWGIKGYLFSKENPVVSLEEAVAEKRKQNFFLLKEKYEDGKHRFRSEIINLHLQIFVMEMWNMFAEDIAQQIKSNESSSIFQRFLQMAQFHCMEHREVEYYAGQLFVTPKYLSEICKKSSGKNASEWIQNYATSRLILLLRYENLTFTDNADAMNFSSRSFFSRYVKKVLGVKPGEYRARLR